MAETTTKQQTAAPQAAPAAQPIAKITAKEAWETFRDQLQQRADEIGSQLPPNVTKDRFLGASLAAVKSNPDILAATPRSLMAALTKAAQDGLLPDGREGIITVFNTTVNGKKEAVAQWNPMFYGLRKRARELDGIIIDAQVVFTGDDFDYELGDQPFIKHKPKPRSELLDASHGIAVYAIFRQEQGGILHREVMWKPEVFATMNQSRAKGSLMWTTFWTEGWRKTVGRRGAKSVPVSPQLERLITRDDDNFTFADSTPPHLSGPPSPPPPPPEDQAGVVHVEGQQNQSVTGALEESGAETTKVVQSDADDFNNDDSGVTTLPDPALNIDAYLVRLDEELAFCVNPGDVEEGYAGILEGVELDPAARKRAEAVRDEHLARVNK